MQQRPFRRLGRRGRPCRPARPEGNYFEALSGDAVEYIIYTSVEDQIERVGAYIETLNARGYDPEQITIITVHGHREPPFAEIKTVGGHRLRRLAGYTDDGHQCMTAGTLAFDSVRPYKEPTDSGRHPSRRALSQLGMPTQRESCSIPA